MSYSPSLDLQIAVRDTLLASDVIRGFVGNRVFDTVRSGQFPYIHLDDDFIRGEQDSGEFYRCEVNVHVYSTAPGTQEVRRISDAVANALDVELELDNFSCHENFLLDVHQIRDPDGVTQHRVVRLQYLLQARE